MYEQWPVVRSYGSVMTSSRLNWLPSAQFSEKGGAYGVLIYYDLCLAAGLCVTLQEGPLLHCYPLCILQPPVVVYCPLFTCPFCLLLYSVVVPRHPFAIFDVWVLDFLEPTFRNTRGCRFHGSVSSSLFPFSGRCYFLLRLLIHLQLPVSFLCFLHVFHRLLRLDGRVFLLLLLLGVVSPLSCARDKMGVVIWGNQFSA